jgi:urease accessory protein
MRDCKHRAALTPATKQAFPRLQVPLIKSASIAAFAICISQLAQAHISKGESSGFLSGVLHPISGLDHVLAMISVGLWGAQMGSPAVWVLPVAFPMVMALGGLMGLLGIPLPGTEYGIAASMILLGSVVVIAWKPPLWVAALLVSVFAIFHGHSHGTELPPGQDGLMYSVGFVCATGCLHGIGVSVGLVHRWSWGQVFLRLSGAFVAAMGVYFFCKALP